MIVKALAAAGLLAAPVPAQSPVVEQSPVPLVICPLPFGYSAGTAFRVSAHLLLSVKHVTSASSACQIDGQKINVVYTGEDQDFSILIDPRPGKFLRVDCGGYIAGRKYIALGHARGLDQLTTVEMIATGRVRGGFNELRGIFTVVPGQSGGAILDAETGRVVGTVNVYDMPTGTSGSVALKDTPVCKR